MKSLRFTGIAVVALPTVLTIQACAANSRNWTLDRERLQGATAALEASVAADAFPGAVLAVGLRDTVLFTAVGHYGDDDPRPVGDSTVYDLASLTKVIGLTTAVMLLVADGAIDLDDPVDHYLPSFAGPGKDAVTIRHLLTHTAGLEAWRRMAVSASPSWKISSRRSPR